jgi:hypothetical protein
MGCQVDRIGPNRLAWKLRQKDVAAVRGGGCLGWVAGIVEAGYFTRLEPGCSDGQSIGGLVDGGSIWRTYIVVGHMACLQEEESESTGWHGLKRKFLATFA